MAKRENTKITDNSYLQFSKIPPQATDLEEAVLGALMLEKDSISKVAGELKPEMFYKEAHQHIYEAIKDLYLKVQPVDLLTVTRRLKDKGMLDVIGGPVYLVQCQKAVVSSSNIEYHSKIIIQKYLAREIIRISSELATEAYEDTTDIFELIEKSQSEMFSLTNFENVQIVPMSENVRLYVDYIDKSFDKQITGIPTGFTLFDRHTKGLQPTDLIIIAAESSVGKTSFALSIVSNVVLQGYGVFFASYEMSNIQLTGRILSGMSEVIQDEILR